MTPEMEAMAMEMEARDRQALRKFERRLLNLARKAWGDPLLSVKRIVDAGVTSYEVETRWSDTIATGETEMDALLSVLERRL